jgi:hypothetical protein
MRALTLPSRKPSKGSRRLVSEGEGVEGTSLNPYGADGMLDGNPYWNGRLPWLASNPLCTGYHTPFRDALTGYAYCRECGFSFGLV